MFRTPRTQFPSLPLEWQKYIKFLSTASESDPEPSTYGSGALMTCQSRKRGNRAHQGRRASHVEPPAQWGALFTIQRTQASTSNIQNTINIWLEQTPYVLAFGTQLEINKCIGSWKVNKPEVLEAGRILGVGGGGRGGRNSTLPFRCLSCLLSIITFDLCSWDSCFRTNLLSTYLARM